jgi:phage gpG-like protein
MNEVRIGFDGQTLKTIERLRTMNPRLLGASARGMSKATREIHGKITTERLTGQGPFPVSMHKLGVRTGQLRRTLRWTKAEISGNSVETTIGSNVRYAAAHEFGFEGTVPVKAHTRTRHFSAKGKRLTKAGALAQARKGQAVTGFVSQVRAHSRKASIPERAPIRTGIEDHRDLMRQEIAGAVRSTQSA